VPDVAGPPLAEQGAGGEGSRRLSAPASAEPGFRVAIRDSGPGQDAPQLPANLRHRHAQAKNRRRRRDTSGQDPDRPWRNRPPFRTQNDHWPARRVAPGVTTSASQHRSKPGLPATPSGRRAHRVVGRVQASPAPTGSVQLGPQGGRKEKKEKKKKFDGSAPRSISSSSPPPPRFMTPSVISFGGACSRSSRSSSRRGPGRPSPARKKSSWLGGASPAEPGHMEHRDRHRRPGSCTRGRPGSARGGDFAKHMFGERE